MTLRPNQKRILSKILESKNHSYSEFMVDFCTETYQNWKIEQLCNWINEEFMIHGSDENEKLNEYGFQLEELLDVINRRRLHR